MGKSSSTNSTITKYDKEINALLSRLNTGCRLVDYETTFVNKNKPSSIISNTLRNVSFPDEVHSELGNTLALSYIELISSSLPRVSSSSDDDEVQLSNIIESGDNIIHTLCCGEATSSNDSNQSSSSTSNRGRLNYASVAYTFFHHLQSIFMLGNNNDVEDNSIKKFILNQWQKWCIRCEELVIIPEDTLSLECNGGGVHVLNSCIKCFSYVCNRFNSSNEEEAISHVYESLVHHSSRKLLIKTFIGSASSTTLIGLQGGSAATTNFVDIVSPLFHACVLRTRSKGSNQSCIHVERQLIVQELLRVCLTTLLTSFSKNRDLAVVEVARLVKYLTTSLTSYLNQSTHASFIREQSSEGAHQPITDMFDLGYGWLRGICDTMISLVSPPVLGNQNDDIILNAVSTSIEEITKTILSQFPNSIYEMEFIYSSLGKCISALPSERVLPMANSTVALRLGTLVLNLPDGKEVELLLDLIWSIFKCLENTRNDDGYDNAFIGGILSSIGCVCRCRTSCADNASNLYNLGKMILKSKGVKDEQKSHDDEGMHLMDVIANTIDTTDFQPLIEIISSSISDTGSSSSSPFNNWQRRPLSLSDQSSGLLIGLSLLHLSISSPGMKTADALSFLRSFLQYYPRLASRAIPSVIDIARTCLTTNFQAATLITLPLEFLSDPCVVSDPHSASLVWSFMSSLVSEEVPATIRSTVIRLLPRMCLSNKRLFRRVMGVIGKAMVAQDPIMRISGTAALAELAQLDLLRDIEQIIGSVQNSLTDEEPAVLYNALEVLRYLIVNEELEFDLVIKVLEKRLNITISDMDTILGLNILALEGLVSLLGEGGLEEEEDEDDESKGEGPEPSPQSIKAVSLLVNLALKGTSGWDEDETIRLQQKIGSLANYSSVLLGLDSEAIRGWNGIDTSEDNSEEVRRFINLKTIAINGLNLAKSSVDDTLLESVSKISKTMLMFEEDVHGSSLFKGTSSSSSNNANKGREHKQPHISKSVLSSLPAASTIEERYQEDPRSSTATAVLYSIGFSEDTPLDTESILTQISECFGDIVNEPLVDPAYQAIKICSLIYSFKSVWKSIQVADDGIREELMDKVVSQLSDEWSETVGEYAYVAMSAFALSIDDDPACSAGVASIQNTILEGQDNYLFENDEIKILCLGMTTARLCRTTDARVDGLIDLIEKSLLENSQQVCFGALFGLAIIMSNLSEKSNDTDSSDTWRRERAQRILSIIMTAFNSCLTQDCDVVVTLVESLGQTNYDQLSEMSFDLDCLNVKDGYHLKLKAVLIALGHSFPTLRSISSALLECVIDVLNTLPLGSGMGLVLHAAYKAAIDSDVMTQTELSEAITTTSSHVQESVDGVGDALLALISLCQLSKGDTKQELDLVAMKCREINSDTSSSDDDKLMTILASCASLGDLPGLVTLTPSIHPSLKKSFIVDIVKLLEESASDAEKLKLRDASTIGLGMLCAMSTQGRQMQKKSASGNKFSSIQAKDGSLLLGILQEVENALQRGSADNLCCLFSSLESIAMPGSFSKVIELALNGSSNEVKVSCLRLLASQLETGRRRIGFDGRGFVDLYTRLAKMAVDKLQALVSIDGMPIFVSSLPNIVYQLPTTVAGEISTSYLWAISKASSAKSTVAYLHGLMTILASANNDKDEKPATRKTISPALLRSFHKHITTQVFSDLCTNEVNTKSVWYVYLQCLGIIPSTVVSESTDLNGDVTPSNVYGLAICAQSPKATRKVESWIARHETESTTSSLRVLILPILITAMQSRNDNEMKDSILSLFDIMLVKGVDNMSLYLIAAKIAFWFDSRSVSKQLQYYLDLPSDRTSVMSSFFVGEKLVFDANKLSSELLIKIFYGFIEDLPTKLAVLCNIWKISDDVSNRASRILSASSTKNDSGVVRVLSCLERIVQGSQR